MDSRNDSMKRRITEQATHGVDLDQAGRVAVIVGGRRGLSSGVEQEAHVAELRVVDQRLEVRRVVDRLLVGLLLPTVLDVGEQQAEAARLEVVLLAADPLGGALVAVDAEVQVTVAAPPQEHINTVQTKMGLNLSPVRGITRRSSRQAC